MFVAKKVKRKGRSPHPRGKLEESKTFFQFSYCKMIPEVCSSLLLSTVKCVASCKERLCCVTTSQSTENRRDVTSSLRTIPTFYVYLHPTDRTFLNFVKRSSGNFSIKCSDPASINHSMSSVFSESSSLNRPLKKPS